MASADQIRNLFVLARQSYFWRDRSVRLLLAGSLALWLVIVFVSLQVMQKETDFIPLHYTVFFGVDLVAAKWNALVFPSIGFLIIGVNGFLGWIAYKPFRFATSLLLWGAFIAHALLLFSLGLVRAL